jgi:hypothetical protein
VTGRIHSGSRIQDPIEEVLDPSGLGYDPVAGSSVNDEEASDSVKSQEVLLTS